MTVALVTLSGILLAAVLCLAVLLAVSDLLSLGQWLSRLLAIRYNSSTYFEGAFLMVLFGFVSSVALAKFLLRGEVIE